MARGIERRPIFITDDDRLDFFDRLDRLVEVGALSIYAFSLMPNHFHILARTGGRSISSAMSSLLTGYAVSFNARHTRVGHLFQNRFKSILCEETGYLRELVRYIHLNPLRAKILQTIDDLDHDPTTGHAAILGNRPARFLDVDHVLQAFGEDRESARLAYRTFVAAGLSQATGETPTRDEIRGATARLLERNLRQQVEERILGSGEFVAGIRKETPVPSIAPRSEVSPTLETLIDAVTVATGAPRAALTAGSKLPECSKAREGLAFLWIDHFGRSGRDLAEAMGIRLDSLNRAARRGRAEKERWLSISAGSRLSRAS
jgi:REP-associated tyrosine transposase